MTPTENTDRRIEIERLLRQCVQCGLCLPHCATWQATGNEVLSPRGRLLVVGDWLAQDVATAPAAYQQAMDLCIGCRACETACPSGVPYSLLEYGQQLAAAVSPPGASTSVWQRQTRSLTRHLDVVPVLRILGWLGRLGRGVLKILAGSRWRRRLAGGPLKTGALVRLLSSMPRAAHSDQELVHLIVGMTSGVTAGSAGAGTGTKSDRPKPDDLSAPTVAFFTGCANAALLPQTSQRLLDMLSAAGCRVQVVPDQDCCGALAAHTGRPGRAAALRRRNRTAFAEALADGARIVVEAAGCGLELQQYGGDFTDRVVDATVLLSELDLPPLAPLPLRVALHDPCHLRHGQGVIAAPRILLGRIPGLQIVEPDEAEVCCGSGGAWGLHHQQLSSDIGRRKARLLAETGADLVVTTNAGCLGQIADGLALEAADLPILPLSDLLWTAMSLTRSGVGARRVD